MLSKRDMKSIILNKVVIEPDRKRLEKILQFARRTWSSKGRGGIFLITGDYGTGKTTLLRAMMEICNPKTTTFIDHSPFPVGGKLVYWRFLVAIGLDAQAIEMPRIELVTSLNTALAIQTKGV